MSDVRATCTPAPPSAYAIATRLARRAAAEGLDLSALRCAMVGAEPIGPHVLRELRRRARAVRLRTRGVLPRLRPRRGDRGRDLPARPASDPRSTGSTARSSSATAVPSPPARGPAHSSSSASVARCPGPSCGSCATASAVGEREEGELLVRAPSLMDGYYADGAATAAAIDADGWLATGDLGYLAGGDLFVTGRSKDLIIKGGHNLMPAPIEEIAGGVEGIRAGCVVAVGVPSARRATELLVVVAETKADARRAPAARAARPRRARPPRDRSGPRRARRPRRHPADDERQGPAARGRADARAALIAVWQPARHG